MPFLLVTVGLIMIVTGSRDTYKQFASTLANDFTGPGNFVYWIASLGAVGALGYFEAFRRFSHYFMALIIIVMVLANGNPNQAGGGFFQKIQEFLKGNAAIPNSVSGAKAPETPKATASDTSSFDTDKAIKIAETVLPYVII